jgi:hypothetical protein
MISMTVLATKRTDRAPRRPLERLRLGSMSLVALALVAAPSWAGATVFDFTGSNIVFERPAPLFTSSTITGTLTLDDAIAPGESFGSSSVTGLSLNFAGIVGTLADVEADIAPGPVQLFGTRSADGSGFSVFDFRFGFPPSTPGCSFVCAGQILINSPLQGDDTPNFIALDDIDGNTLSIIDDFTPNFVAVTGGVPEPSMWAMMLVGLGGLGVMLRRRRPAQAVLA